MFEESMQRAFLAVAIVFSITVVIALIDPRPSTSATLSEETLSEEGDHESTVAEAADTETAESIALETPTPAPIVSISETIHQHEQRSGLTMQAPMGGCTTIASDLAPGDLANRFLCEPGNVRPSAPGQVIVVVRESALAGEQPPLVAEAWAWERGLSIGPFIVIDHGPQSVAASAISVYSGFTEINELMSPGRQVDFDTVLGTNLATADAPNDPAALGFELWVDDQPNDHDMAEPTHLTVDAALAQAGRLATIIVSPADNTCPFPGSETNNLPNAPRTYRSGTHQGVDLNCAEPGHSAKAVADGRAVMSVNDFEDPAPGARNATLDNAAAAGTTPHWILTMLYGNFVVVDHGSIEGIGQVTTIYAHLERVDNGIRLGGAGARGQRLGEIGNTGTSTAAAALTTQEPNSIHLHWEIFVDGQYLGQGLSGEETAVVYDALLCPTGTALSGC